MKVWLDVANSPHVAFLLPFIERIRQDGGGVVVTARDFANTLGLLRRYDVPFERIDGHGGKKLHKKGSAFLQRCSALYRFVKTQSVDVAFTQSSFYVPVVARWAGIANVYTNDNEHAKGNYLAYAFADRVFFPEAMRSVAKGGVFKRKLCYYPGVKEGIYLSKGQPPTAGAGDGGAIYFRPEPWLAQYHAAQREYSCEIIRELLEHGSVTVLPRDDSQRSFFAEHFRENPEVTISREVVSLEDIVRTGQLFVGAGGSMSRETAVLGLPTVSVYTGLPLAVDDYLCHLGILRRANDLEALRKQLNELSSPQTAATSGSLIIHGRRAFEQLYRALCELA